jgi:alpha-tubulin suppressor-like RCC1 family protein
VSTEPKTKRRARRLAWIAGAIVFACSGDARVGCSPSLTCSLRESRFAPPMQEDAGPSRCDQTQNVCPAAQLSLGGTHACVITDSRDLLCWGDDAEGQRGRDLDVLMGARAADAGDYIYGFARVFDAVRLVSAGGAHTCAVLDNGFTECWGRGREGQVNGSARRMASEEPVVVPIADVLAISAGGAHTCAATLQGVMCWGDNRYGQSGRDLSVASTEPQLVPGTQGATQVASGARHTCALFGDGHVACWGELIDAAGEPHITTQATAVPGLRGAQLISAGGGHSCALTSDAVMCWGHNENGQLGDGTLISHATAAPVLELEAGAGDVAAGGGEVDGQLVGHTCSMDRASRVWCWGHNDEGQLGVSLHADQSHPLPVLRLSNDGGESLDDIARVALGAAFSCALGSRGAVWCWGDDGAYQLGNRIESEFDRSPPPGSVARVQRFGRER